MRFLRAQTACVACLFCIVLCCPILACAYTGLEYRAFEMSPDSPVDTSAGSLSGNSIMIPGPLRSFLRMAGISQGAPTEDVLPMLARNVSLYGFERGQETEFLILLNRYVQMAWDLQRLTNAEGSLHISGCGDSSALLNVLGYKLQQSCGHRNTALVTANAERAFITLDSGFPLTELEQALQKDKAFTYSFPATRVPILLREKDWVSVSKWNRKSDQSLLNVLLHDRELDRLYASMARYNQETLIALDQSEGLRRLAPHAAVIDLYGSQIRVVSGRVAVPGNAEKAWEDLAGESPASPQSFVAHLLTKDGGWLAAYFDVLSRLDQTEQAHLTESNRLRRFYERYRSTAIRWDASKGLYPKNADLLILLASLKWKEDGDFEIPGDLSVWDEILSQMAKSREMRSWLGRGHEWNKSGRLLETLVASSNLRSESGPVEVFLMLSAMSSARPADHQLSGETERLIARRFSYYNHWFPIFAEFPALDDSAIARFISAADRVGGISNPTLRANALGAFQANLELWQIFARQNQIPADQLNTSWMNAVQPFVGVNSSLQLFDAARSSVQAILQGASGNRNLSQDQIVDLLAGPVRNDREGQRVHHDLAEKIHAVLEDQRLVPLDTLFGLYDGMNDMAHGAAVGASLLPLAEGLREFEMPRAIFTQGEKSSWAPVVYSSRHAELQVRTDLARTLRASPSPSQLETARGQLTPFLRDTLVGLIYAYYEPPGAEVLHNNPLFVRSHDFSSISVQGAQETWGVPRLIGVGATAGGGAYLLGSLADLPYALASTEGDFIVPKNVQALIWQEVVPQLLVDSMLPRWWNVSRQELHFAALYQRAGEEILTGAATDADLRTKATAILSERMTPVRLERIEQALQRPDTRGVVNQITPAEVFYLGIEFRKKYPEQAAMLGKASRELDDLSRKYPSEGSWERLSRDFGVPHPALMVTNSCALLSLNPISTFEGNAGKMFAGSWDSNNLYWARLADEKGYPPDELNLLVPELTRDMIANIFASNFDDWNALLRAMVETGNEFRQGQIAAQPLTAMSR